MRKLAALILATATAAALALAGCGQHADAHTPDAPATVSYAFYLTDTYTDATIDGLMAADNADYEQDSPHCTKVALTPDTDAYACISVPLAEAGPYADDASYDVHFTDDGELAYADGTVLAMFRALA